MTPAERALLLAVSEIAQGQYLGHPAKYNALAKIIAAVEAEADTTPETDDENEIAEEWDHMSGEIGRPDTTSWNAWYEGVPEDLKCKLSFHDLRRLGRHAVSVFLTTSPVEADAEPVKACRTCALLDRSGCRNQDQALCYATIYSSWQPKEGPK